MSKQQKYHIVANMENVFRVEELKMGTWCTVFIGGEGQVGLERAEEWLAKRKD